MQAEIDTYHIWAEQYEIPGFENPNLHTSKKASTDRCGYVVPNDVCIGCIDIDSATIQCSQPQWIKIKKEQRKKKYSLDSELSMSRGFLQRQLDLNNENN